MGFMQGAGKLLKAAGKRIYDRGALKQGVQAFKSWKQKPTDGATPQAASSALKQVGSFDTGIDTNLKVPKVSDFGKGELFSSKTYGGRM
jgi:hypothetical protein